ncbi:MAG: enolase C-terminal domain-like protein [Acidobacteriota bacterium]
MSSANSLLSRRDVLRGALVAPWFLRAKGVGPKPTDIRIEDVQFDFEDYLYRAPYQFGGRTADRVTLLNVHCRVTTQAGRSARGFGSMTLGNQWSFPSRRMDYAATLAAMKALAVRIAKVTGGCKEFGHPIELNYLLEPEYLKMAAEVSTQLRLAEPIPKLCTLVTASPFDAAIHDAFGKIHGRNCYRTYGRDLVNYDLARYLGPDFKGHSLDRYVLKKAVARMPIYHSVGALDPIVESDIQKRIGDGLPETLPEWIRYNGITHVKIKLNGQDREGDVARILKIDRAVAETQQARGVKTWKYLLDFNENCPNVEFLLEVLRRVRAATPRGFEQIQYVEQPTARDLASHRENVMHEAAKLRPVVIDESLTDLESLLLGREMGYTGVALKACKGQSQAVLMAAAAQRYGMFLCVQDLTCPGAALLHSAGLAAHVPGVAAIEANARQYVPAANKPWESRFPGIFRIRDGTIRTSELDGLGLGAVRP